MSTAIEKQSLRKVMANLNKEIQGINNRSLKGLIEGVIIVRRDMEKTSPRIPVDTGNLRQSFFSVASKGSTSHGKAPRFKGKNASKLMSDHATIKAACSGRAQMQQAKGFPTVILGFSANYALAVHEKYGANFQRPGAGAGFFVASLKRNKKKILNEIKKNAKVKK